MLFIFQIILIIFFLLFAWLSGKDIKHGIYSVIFLMPTYLIRFSVFGIPTTALEIMIYILFLVWLFKNKNNLKIFESIKNFYDSDRLLFWGITFLFLGVVLSTLHSINIRTSFGILKGWFFDPFLFFIIFISEIKTQKQIINSLLNFILSGFAVALIGLFYTLNNNLTFDGRLRAFYESPNYLAMYLAPGFLFAIYLFIFRKDLWNYADNAENNNYKIESRKSINPSIFHSAAERRNPFITIKRALHRLNVAKGFFGLPQNDKNNKLLQETSSFSSNIKFLSMVELQKIQIIILLVFAIALFLTKSYGTFSGIVVALVLLLFRNYKDKKIFIDKNAKKNIHVFSVIILLLFSFVSYQKYQQIINSNERSSLHSRLMIWNSSFEMLKDSPVFGIGPGTFQQVYLDYQSHFSVPYLEWAVAEPHNTFLAFYLESGFVGFVGFILILFWFYKRSKTNDIIFLFLIYFLIHGLVDTLYWKNDLAMVFWMMVAAGVIFKINNLQSK